MKIVEIRANFQHFPARQMYRDDPYSLSAYASVFTDHIPTISISFPLCVLQHLFVVIPAVYARYEDLSEEVKRNENR